MMVQEQVANVGGVLLQLLLPVVTALGGLALNAFKNWLATHTRNQTVRGAMVILSDVVQTTVQQVEQTVTKKLRDANGYLDPKFAAQVKEEAISQVQALYGPQGIKDLSRRLGASEDATLRYIGALIEQAVFLLRNPAPPPLNPAPPPAVFDANIFGGMTPAERAAAQAAK